MKCFATMLAGLMLSSAASAGIYSDDMARCLVSSTSAKDKTDLARWVFVTASVHPDVAAVISVPANMKDELDHQVAVLFERLVTDVCRKQAQEAMKYEGALAFQKSFATLGEVAMQELMSNAAVAAGFSSYVKYLDKSKFEALGIK